MNFTPEKYFSKKCFTRSFSTQKVCFMKVYLFFWFLTYLKKYGHFLAFQKNTNFHYYEWNSFHLYKQNFFVKDQIFPWIFRHSIFREKYEKIRFWLEIGRKNCSIFTLFFSLNWRKISRLPKNRGKSLFFIFKAINL